ncbi:bifunctional folylpolyglutamate synthase/dihydrofolate synthase [Alicyclobacillus fodiniaquatilis]|uniref:Bifunctional folylpolyglutamate synthase/dihydrofolate synthase n=1 Tax=Alicyclobacillus fodiniaquatilis TaxID=1661150 RepID=A0ABW4JE68_9BACL
MIEQLVTQAIHSVYASYGRVSKQIERGYDRDVRHPEWTRWLLNQLGNPDANQFNVAVTGSKGKGSHAILMAAILQRLGLRVGLFTSPHLVDFLERLRVDGQMIAGEQFVSYAKLVEDEVNRAPLPNGQYFGPVGLLAVMASLYFRDMQTDVNVFELGRGARHDDVNQIRHRGALLTPVFPEHLDKLGPTWLDVADEKFGVITPDVKWLISYTQASFVEERLLALGAAGADVAQGLSIASLGRDFDVSVAEESDGGGKVATVTTTWRGKILRAKIPDSLFPFVGNVAVALVGAAHVMRDLTGTVQDVDVELTGLRLAGRLQVIQDKPTCLLDGTIHKENAKFIAKWLQAREKTGKIGAILSLPDGKDAPGVLEELGSYCDWLLFTHCTNKHMRYTRDFQQLGLQYVNQVDVEPDVHKAIAMALDKSRAEDVLIFAGTQSYVGDVLRAFETPTESIWIP